VSFQCWLLAYLMVWTALNQVKALGLRTLRWGVLSQAEQVLALQIKTPKATFGMARAVKAVVWKMVADLWWNYNSGRWRQFHTHQVREKFLSIEVSRHPA
jgi:hypothetical protein